ncbi:peptidylprolyl isomerase [Pulveribacter suum]|uniref:peptidylprolyl isomerase n=1 Tax=Pulveribacter suum TaxID=2116657 RepID=A0A2P1NP62_9BURK|nr:peptidylprolyl isomerase [Pulveribacter suum]AVP58850.1 peptidylprolyl isomerase [Pulveribacter suum]
MKLSTIPFLTLRGAAVAALLAGTPWAFAADGQVLMQGERFAITSADVEADARLRIPPDVRSQVLSRAQTVGQIASNLYIYRAWAHDAQAKGLEQDPEVAAALRVARDKVLSDAWLARLEREHALSDAAALDMARAMYRAKPERFKIPEQVHARHILIEGTTPEARAQAEKLLADLKGGADFAKLAQEHSADKSNAPKGGDLGFFAKGRMVPEFEEAAFALKNKGDLSGVVQTQFGYHLIQLEGRTPEGMRPFEEVRDELVKEVRATVVNDARIAEAQKIQASGKPDNEAIEAFAARHAKQAPAAPAPAAQKQQ